MKPKKVQAYLADSDDFGMVEQRFDISERGLRQIISLVRMVTRCSEDTSIFLSQRKGGLRGREINGGYDYRGDSSLVRTLEHQLKIILKFRPLQVGVAVNQRLQIWAPLSASINSSFLNSGSGGRKVISACGL